MPSRVIGWGRRRIKADRRYAGKAKNKADLIATIQREAKEHGATLKSDGEGGLDPQIALDAFREADWRCENPYCPEPQKDLDLDHQSGHPREIWEDPDAWTDPKAMRAAKNPDPKDNATIHVLCARCHDAVHERERALEEGRDPSPMPGRDDDE